MSIYININGQQSGPFEDEVVIDQLRTGQLSPDDMAIRQGEKDWQPLGRMFPEPTVPVSTAAINAGRPNPKAAAAAKCSAGFY